jgi:murein DD-endopeptidase MepM/ murein hydrolase activator NlpD
LPRADAAKTDLLSATPWVSLDLHPLPLEAGRTDALRLTVDGKGALSATFLGHALNFLQNGSEYAAVFGVDRWTKPGVYPLTLEFKDAAGKTHTLERRILVVKGNYAREVLQLTGEAAQARADPQVVAAEQAYIVQKMGRFTPQKFWSGVFQIPTPGVLTSAFGSVRSINGSGYDSYHTGNDLAISLGTPIVAPADGTVVDTGFLDIRGLVTIIDHGAGVYTGYWHQSSVLVHPGDKVVPGQQIGTVGNTGSSTAPHLHWEMWVGGVPVDALQWVREVFP